MNVAWCCAILLSFAARSRKSYWSGCIQAAIVICQQIFEILALLIFLFFLKKCSAEKKVAVELGLRESP